GKGRSGYQRRYNLFRQCERFAPRNNSIPRTHSPIIRASRQRLRGFHASDAETSERLERTDLPTFRVRRRTRRETENGNRPPSSSSTRTKIKPPIRLMQIRRRQKSLNIPKPSLRAHR